MSKKLRLTMKTAMTLEEGITEFYLNCEARNLRAGTIKYYRDSVKQIYKVVPPETPIYTIDEDTWDTYKITLREKAYLDN